MYMASFCPRCGLAVQASFAFCPKCGASLPKLPVEKEVSNLPVQNSCPEPQPTVTKSASHYRSVLTGEEVTFRCHDSNQPIASAVIPVGFSYVAKIYNEDYNDFSPCRDAIMVYNDDSGITIRTDSKVFWEDYISVLVRQGAAVGGINPNNEGAFREPEELMLSYGKPSKDSVLMPVATAELPGWFAKNGQTMLNHMIQNLIDSDKLVANVKSEIVNKTCQPLLMKFKGQDKGRDIVVLVGCEYLGYEVRNAISPLTMMGGAFGMIGGLVSMKRSAQTNQPDGSIPFGHSKEYGKQPDIIHWGYNRIYSCVTDPEREAEATEAFLKFIVSFHPDQALELRRVQREAEIQMQVIQQSNTLAAQARQQQMMAQQRAIEASRQIARNSEEIRAGMMDSWNRKMASDSRISTARSEAIRGVNTYETGYGRPVEVSVSADHVYENSYGDVYGVSGPAVDQDVLNRLKWTEIERK